MDQSLLRQKYIGIRNAQNIKDVSVWSSKILTKLLQTKAYKDAQTIFAYVGVKNEVDTFALIERALSDDKTISVPKTFKNGIMKFYALDALEGLKLGKFGLLEPINTTLEVQSDDKTLMIVPGVLFDTDCNRMGYGAGFYDRYLAVHDYGLAVGLAFDLQVVENINANEWDVKMNAILTENKTIGSIL